MFYRIFPDVRLYPVHKHAMVSEKFRRYVSIILSKSCLPEYAFTIFSQQPPAAFFGPSPQVPALLFRILIGCSSSVCGWPDWRHLRGSLSDSCTFLSDACPLFPQVPPGTLPKGHKRQEREAARPPIFIIIQRVQA